MVEENSDEEWKQRGPGAGAAAADGLLAGYWEDQDGAIIAVEGVSMRGPDGTLDFVLEARGSRSCILHFGSGYAIEAERSADGRLVWGDGSIWLRAGAGAGGGAAGRGGAPAEASPAAARTGNEECSLVSPHAQAEEGGPFADFDSRFASSLVPAYVASSPMALVERVHTIRGRKLRILALHGGGSNSNIMKFQTTRLKLALGSQAEWLYPDASEPWDSAGERMGGPIWDLYFAERSEVEKRLAKGQPFVAWFNLIADTDNLHPEPASYKRSHEILKKYVEQSGPIDVVIAFGMSTIVINRVAFEFLREGQCVPWKMNLFFCPSGPTREDCFTELLREPTFLISSWADPENMGSWRTSKMFENFYGFEHDEGRGFPTREPRASEIYGQLVEVVRKFFGLPAPAAKVARDCYIVGSWARGGFEKMEPSAEHDDVWQVQFRIGSSGQEEFQLAFDRDLAQAIYPAGEKVINTSVPVRGPDAGGKGRSWLVRGQPKELVRVRFAVQGTRTSMSLFAKNRERKWAGEVPAQKDAARQKEYFVTGTFNGWGLTPLARSEKTPGVYLHRFRIATEDKRQAAGAEEFQIVIDQDRTKTLHPDRARASSGAAFLRGPDGKGHGLNWRVEGPVRAEVEIVFDTQVKDSQQMVSWKTVGGGPRVAAGCQVLLDSRRRIADAGGTWYKVLDIAPSSAIDEAKRAFRELALIHHPDKIKEANLVEDDTFKVVQRAYEEAQLHCPARKTAECTPAPKPEGAKQPAPRDGPNSFLVREELRTSAMQRMEAWAFRGPGEGTSPDDVRSVSPEELATMFITGSCLIIDTREPEKAKDRFFPGALQELCYVKARSLPYECMQLLQPLRDDGRQIVVVSVAGNQCRKYCTMLVDVFGFKLSRVCRLDGGLRGWDTWEQKHRDRGAEVREACGWTPWVAGEYWCFGDENEDAADDEYETAW